MLKPIYSEDQIPDGNPQPSLQDPLGGIGFDLLKDYLKENEGIDLVQFNGLSRYVAESTGDLVRVEGNRLLISDVANPDIPHTTIGNIHYKVEEHFQFPLDSLMRKSGALDRYELSDDFFLELHSLGITKEVRQQYQLNPAQYSQAIKAAIEKKSGLSWRQAVSIEVQGLNSIKKVITTLDEMAKWAKNFARFGSHGALVMSQARMSHIYHDAFDGLPPADVMEYLIQHQLATHVTQHVGKAYFTIGKSEGERRAHVLGSDLVLHAHGELIPEERHSNFSEGFQHWRRQRMSSAAAHYRQGILRTSLKK